jgi:hypothetical protein
MIPTPDTAVTAFDGRRRIAAGPLRTAVADILAAIAAGAHPLLFDDATAEPVDLDLRGSARDVLARLEPAAPKGPGRPKLGVVPREVTLLPRHWEWLGQQPGGASVALRKLVEVARRGEGLAEVRAAQTAANRFMSAVAGDLPGFEEAGRALFAKDRAGFERETSGWPADVRDYARKLAQPAFA